MAETSQVQLSQDGDELRLALPADFRIEGAKAFAAIVQRLLREPPARVVLDAAKVERIDTAALQALAVAWPALRAAGIAARWDACPPNFMAGAGLLGLAAAAGIPNGNGA